MSPQNAAKHGVNPFKNEIMSEVQFKPRQENTQNPIRTIPINNETIKYSIIVLAVLVKTKTAFYKKLSKNVLTNRGKQAIMLQRMRKWLPYPLWRCTQEAEEAPLLRV